MTLAASAKGILFKTEGKLIPYAEISKKPSVWLTHEVANEIRYTKLIFYLKSDHISILVICFILFFQKKNSKGLQQLGPEYIEVKWLKI